MNITAMYIKNFLKFVFFFISLASFYFSGKYIYLTYYPGAHIKIATYKYPSAQNSIETSDQSLDKVTMQIPSDEEGKSNVVQRIHTQYNILSYKQDIKEIIKQFLLENKEYIKKILREIQEDKTNEVKMSESNK